jgi:hypothetical protein
MNNSGQCNALIRKTFSNQILNTQFITKSGGDDNIGGPVEYSATGLFLSTRSELISAVCGIKLSWQNDETSLTDVGSWSVFNLKLTSLLSQHPFLEAILPPLQAASYLEEKLILSNLPQQ